ncbi:MAG: TRM11 family SAM-dependent methyltransferase [Candidatus Bathyarchaeia archaeon]
MKEITHEDYLNFLRDHSEVLIEGWRVRLHGEWRVERYAPTSEYELEGTTVWSFPNRGDWATHTGDYRGNFSPFIPRNLILKYTGMEDLVLDQMVGSGTTLIECKLLQRNAIGVDINPDAIMVARDRLNFTYNPKNLDYREPTIRTYVGDARNLDKVEDGSVDLIVTHPPYAYIIPYSRGRLEGDISSLNLAGYLNAMKRIAEESFRVLKENKYCGILIGDTRKNRHFIPIAFRVMQQFLEVGFTLKEDIIKLQHNVLSNRERWRGRHYDFYKIMHEHIFIFRKPTGDEKPPRYSCKWW